MKSIKFSNRVEQIAVSAIKQMPLIARSVPDAVSLGQGIPSVRTPNYIQRYVINALKQDDKIGKYSLQPGMPELKRAVADVVSEKARREVDAEREIFISAGAMEALFAAIVSLVEVGDEVILFDPSYASHIEQVLFAGGVPVFVPMQEDNGWTVCTESLKKAITSKTRAMIVCNPGNPTGKVFSKEELQSIVNIAVENDIFVIADETYDFLVYDDIPFVSLTSFTEIKDQMVACYSFSKQFAMTGWRVGYMYAPSQIIDQALKVHDAVVISAPTISQYAALAALTCDKGDDYEDIKEILANRRSLVCARMEQLGDLFAFSKPEGAYYLFTRYLKTELNSTDFSMKLLQEARVVTIPGRAFGPSGEGHIRLSYGGTEEDINLAFDRIELWNQQLK